MRPPTTYSHSTAYSHSRAIALASTGLSSGTPQDATVQDLMKVVMQQSEMRSVADVRSQHTDSYAFPQKLATLLCRWRRPAATVIVRKRVLWMLAQRNVQKVPNR